MCTLIYLALPSASAVLRLGGGDIRPVESSSFQLRSGEVLFRVSGAFECAGRGNCGTVIGCASRRSRRREQSRMLKQADKLRKEGWSEAKVSAWLAQKNAATAHVRARDADRTDEIARWWSFFDAALGEARLPWVGVMICNAGEEGEVERTEEVRRAELNLQECEERVLYRVRR